MHIKINIFYESFENVEKFSNSELVELFVYFLTEMQGQESAEVKNIKACFSDCDLPVPSDIAVILSRGIKKNSGKFIKAEKGYRLHRTVRDRITARMKAGEVFNPVVDEVAGDLKEHLLNINNADTRSFIEEAIECYERGLLRSAIIMSWVGALHILYDFVINNKMNEFNAEATRINGRHRNVTNIDQLARCMSESIFLDRLEGIGVISNSIKKELIQCLDRRNSSGHPNTYSPTDRTVAHHLDVLIRNIFECY